MYCWLFRLAGEDEGTEDGLSLAKTEGREVAVGPCGIKASDVAEATVGLGTTAVFCLFDRP